jgi:16S rRNA (uracil1498-N3)-methyltransferase
VKTRYFIVSPDAARDGVVVLDGPEFHHGVRVSRVRAGESVRLIDGRGGLYEARVERIESDRAVLSVRSFERTPDPPPVDIALGFIKAPRLEIAVEKCAEIGARAIILVRSERCVRGGEGGVKASALDRLRRKAGASCKQSGRAHVPAIEGVESLDGLARRIASYDRVFLADPGGAASILPALGSGSVLGIVGPEGGLAPAEIERLSGAGAAPLSLGNARLRAETAAICLLYRLISEFPPA